MALSDHHDRPLRSLRLSLTDRCNLRCSYCMPEEDYHWLPRNDILRFEELSRLVDAFVGLGVDRLRLTGGEPLLRRDLPELVATLAARPGIRDLAMTTNGMRLARHARELRDAGLDRLTLSLDTLDRGRFERLTRRDELPRVLEGLEAAQEAGFTDTKLNMVVIRGFNDDELLPMLALGRRHDAQVRFIEYMDVGGASGWSMSQVVPKREILEKLADAYGAPPEAQPGRGRAPAAEFRLPDGSVCGVIASTTEPFCASCDRSRVTADGMWFLCLYALAGHDLRGLLRGGGGDAELRRHLEQVWSGRADRGAEQRFALHEEQRTAQSGANGAHGPTHHQMHVRGG